MTRDFERDAARAGGALPPDKAAALKARIAKARQQLEATEIPRLPAGQRVRASFAQERMWFNARTSRVHAAYNTQVALHLSGALDQQALRRSLEEICRRHDACRMTFVEEDGIVWQHVGPERNDVLTVIDITGAGAGEVRRRINELVTEPFDLERGPLVRWTLLRVSSHSNVLVISDHHSVTDGWSRQIFFDELMQFYSQYASGASIAPPADGNLQYRDFADWQRSWVESADGQKQLAFWKSKLADMPKRLELPTDFVRPPLPSHRGGHLLQTIDGKLIKALGAVSAATGTTSYMVFLAAFAALLYRLSGMDDLPIGTGIANRRMADTDGIVGMLINTCVIRVRPVRGMRLGTLLQQVRELSLEAYANQEAPFDRVVQVVNPARDGSMNPLHQATFNFQNNPMPDVRLPGLAAELERPLFNGSSKYDLYVAGWPQGGDRNGNWMNDGADVLLSWEFSTDLFEAASIARMQAQYLEILRHIAGNLNASIDDLVLGEDHAFGSSAVEAHSSPDTCVHDLVDAWASRTPEAIAVQHLDDTFTFAELARRSSAAGQHLLAIGQGGGLIGVSSRRSLLLPVAILGILKAGSAYVPLDPELPAELLREISSSAGIRHVVCEEGDRRLFEALGLSTSAPSDGAVATGMRLPGVMDRALAYVMFTSGSTGKPKAVAVPHRAVVRLVSGQDFASMGPENSWLLHSPLAFDASTLEIWAPLCNGGRLVIQPDGRYSLRELGETIRQKGVDSLWLTSGLFQLAANEAPECLAPLSQVLTGGDVVPPDAVRRVMRACPSTAIINGYGPTENTTFTCCGRITPPDIDRRSIPIGAPIRGTSVFILDEDLRPCPPGRIGELFAGGLGLAEGYLGDAEATAQRFMQHREFGRLYRTGDLCRVIADGRIEFVGRRDRQVKIAGHRIELAEVEGRLSTLPGVAAVAVVDVRSSARGSFLCAAIVLEDGSNDATLVQVKLAARSVLPAYQVPTDWHVLPELPITSNGKVDTALLQQLAAGQHILASQPRQQASATELRIAAIWSEVLGVQVDDVESDFFAIGGHSLAALRALSLIEKAFGIKLSASLFFGDSSVRSISKVVLETLRSARVTAAKHARLPLIAAGSAYPTLLFVAGGWGEENEILVFARLVRAMKSEAAKFGVRSGVRDRQAEVAVDIRDHAGQIADMVSAERDPRHTIIVGECAASTVAIALAKEFSARGTPALGMVLLDPGDPSHLRSVISRISVPKGDQVPLISRLPPKVARYYDLLSRLPEGPLDVPLHLILSRRFSNTREIEAAWTDYAGRSVSVHTVPGDHNSYLRGHAEDTARMLDEIVSSLVGP